MATPIRPTPILKGKSAERFERILTSQRKTSLANKDTAEARSLAIRLAAEAQAGK